MSKQWHERRRTCPEDLLCHEVLAGLSDTSKISWQCSTENFRTEIAASLHIWPQSKLHVACATVAIDHGAHSAVAAWEKVFQISKYYGNLKGSRHLAICRDKSQCCCEHTYDTIQRLSFHSSGSFEILFHWSIFFLFGCVFCRFSFFLLVMVSGARTPRRLPQLPTVMGYNGLFFNSLKYPLNIWKSIHRFQACSTQCT